MTVWEPREGGRAGFGQIVHSCRDVPGFEPDLENFARQKITKLQKAQILGAWLR